MQEWDGVGHAGVRWGGVGHVGVGFNNFFFFLQFTFNLLQMTQTQEIILVEFQKFTNGHTGVRWGGSYRSGVGHAGVGWG